MEIDSYAPFYLHTKSQLKPSHCVESPVKMFLYFSLPVFDIELAFEHFMPLMKRFMVYLH